MDDLISRQGVLRKMNSVMDIPDVYYLPIHFKEWVIDEMPTIEKRKKGKWIERESGTEDKENGFDTVIVCSCCDFPATTFYSEDCESRTQIRTDFCPNCGADMRGDMDEAD